MRQFTLSGDEDVLLGVTESTTGAITGSGPRVVRGPMSAFARMRSGQRRSTRRTVAGPRSEHAIVLDRPRQAFCIEGDGPELAIGVQDRLAGSGSEAASRLSEALGLVWSGRAGRDLGRVLATVAELLNRVGRDSLRRRVLRWLALHPASAAEHRAWARDQFTDGVAADGELEDTERLLREARRTLEEIEILGASARTGSPRPP